MKKICLKTILLILLSAALLLCSCGGLSFSNGGVSKGSVNHESEKERRIASKSFPQSLPSAQDFASETFEDILIVDVSSWSGEADFSVAKEKGVSGAVLRLARYDLDLDKKFLDYYNSARSAGIYVGCYYFSGAHSVEEALAEASNVISLIDRYGLTFDLPVFYDVEDDGKNEMNSLSRSVLTDMVDAFCGTLCSRGILSGYYCSHSYADDRLISSRLRDYPFWIAEWTYEVTANDYKNVFLWQYTSKLSQEGIEEICDGNKMLRDLVSYTESFKQVYREILSDGT